MRLLFSALTSLFVASAAYTHAQTTSSSIYKPADSGWATLTHYDYPPNFVAACGCVGEVSNYPIAAVNKLVYGAKDSFGPICGSCVKLTLGSTPYSPPPSRGGDGYEYTPKQQADGTAPSVVVKVVDMCPGGEWCNSTTTAGNILGSKIHFDLAWPAPSGAIPLDFFPGKYDYGVWNVSYTFVDCAQWDGYTDPKAQGSDWDQQEWGCCPLAPPLPSDPDYGRVVRKSSVPSNGVLSAAQKPKTCPPYEMVLQKDPAIVPLTANDPSRDDDLLPTTAKTTSKTSSTQKTSSTSTKSTSSSSTKKSSTTISSSTRSSSSTTSRSTAKTSTSAKSTSKKSTSSTTSRQTTKTSSSGSTRVATSTKQSSLKSQTTSVTNAVTKSSSSQKTGSAATKAPSSVSHKSSTCTCRSTSHASNCPSKKTSATSSSAKTLGTFVNESRSMMLAESPSSAVISAASSTPRSISSSSSASSGPSAATSKATSAPSMISSTGSNAKPSSLPAHGLPPLLAGFKGDL